MTKKSLRWIIISAAVLLAVAVVITSVFLFRPSAKLDNLQAFCYPGLEWGMTMEEVREALDCNEVNFSETLRFENETYTSIGVAVRHQEFLGRDVPIEFWFDQFYDSDEPRLSGMTIDMFWENRNPLEGDQKDWVQLLESWLKEQGTEYTLRVEELEYEEGSSGATAYIESKTDFRDQPKRYQKSYGKVYNEKIKLGFVEAPENWSPENPVDLRSDEVRLPLVTIESSFQPRSEEVEGDIPVTTKIFARELAYLVAQSKK